MVNYIHEGKYRLVAYFTGSIDKPSWTVQINERYDDNPVNYLFHGTIEWTAPWYSITALDILGTFSTLLQQMKVRKEEADKLQGKVNTLYETEFNKLWLGDEDLLETLSIEVDLYYSGGVQLINPYTEDLAMDWSDSWRLYMVLGDIYKHNNRLFSLYVQVLQKYALMAGLDEDAFLDGLNELTEKGYVTVSHNVVIPMLKLMTRMGLIKDTD